MPSKGHWYPYLLFIDGLTTMLIQLPTFRTIFCSPSCSTTTSDLKPLEEAQQLLLTASLPSSCPLSDLQTQPHDTQLSLTNHVEKPRALESVMVEHDATKPVVKSTNTRDGEQMEGRGGADGETGAAAGGGYDWWNSRDPGSLGR
jgi:hypothetical protein